MEKFINKLDIIKSIIEHIKKIYEFKDWIKKYCIIEVLIEILSKINKVNNKIILISIIIHILNQEFLKIIKIFEIKIIGKKIIYL